MADGPGLVLVATPIGNLGDLSERAIETLRAVDVIACEDTRRTGSLCHHAEIAHAPFIVCNEHTEARAAAEIVRRIETGESVALVTDAGTPGISDPGERVVRAVLEAGHAVTAVPGANAVLTALILSGLPTDRFVFEGFLPRKGAARTSALEAICAEVRTVVFYESPKRIGRTLADLASVCRVDRPVAVARELTKRFEEVWRGTLEDAAEHFADRAPKGEIVVVIGGAPVEPPGDDELRNELTQRLRSGMSRRQAVDEVVADTGATKRQVYDLALRIDLGPDG